MSDALKQAGSELQRDTDGTISKTDLVAIAVKLCGCTEDSLRPSDHCHNRQNLMHEKRKTERFFLYVGAGTYFYVGENFNWTGTIGSKLTD